MVKNDPSVGGGGWSGGSDEELCNFKYVKVGVAKLGGIIVISKYILWSVILNTEKNNLKQEFLFVVLNIHQQLNKSQLFMCF